MGVGKNIKCIIQPYPHITQNRGMNSICQLDMYSRQTRIFLTPCLSIELPLSIKKINCHTFLPLLFHMFTKDNIYDTFSLHIRIAVQHQISFSYFYMTSVIYITGTTMAFVRQFIFFLRNVLTGSVFRNKAIIINNNDGLENI